MRARRRHARGFTLIEILLALVLLALLMTAAYSGFSASNRAVQRGEAAIDASNKVRVTQQLLRRQVGQALTLAYDQESGTSAPILIEGEGDKLTFVSALPGYLGQGGAYVQRVALEPAEGGGRQLVFRHALLNGFDPTAAEPWAERPVVLLEDIDDLSFEYLGLDDTGQPGEWSDEWEKTDRLPLLVRLEIGFDESSNLRWPTLTIPIQLGGDAVVGGAALGPGALTSAPPPTAAAEAVKTLRNPPRSVPRGAALLLVLWITALLAVILGSFAVLARTELAQSRNLFDTIRARLAAEAGLARAVYELNRPDVMTKWLADGRTYEIDFEGTKIELQVEDESGKVDINAADAGTLQALFQLVGAEEDQARKLAAAVVDWRDPDDLVQPEGAEDAEYEAAGLPYGASDYPFRLAQELQQVLGMDYELYRKVAGLVTVYGGSGRPNASFAPEALLPLFAGVTPELARQIVAQRHALDAAAMQATPLVLPDGTILMAVGGAGTYTVRSRAMLPNGTEAAIEVTLRMGGGPGGRAYSVLRWREAQTGL